jgi:DNA-binding transcriptional LysR family regulator
MHQTNLRGIDLNLLPVLDALLRHRSVSAAAAAINLSQPAASRALARLRDLLDDPLLVRGPQGYVLSARAAALRPALSETLQGIGNLVTEQPLNPAVEERTFNIAMSDAHAVLLMPSLIARLARDAPGITIAIATYGTDLATRMGAGEVDIVFALSTTPLPPGAVSRPLVDDELAVVVSTTHPRAGGIWQMEDYARWPSVAISLVGDGTSDMDTLLARHGVTRRIASVVPNFVTALSIVAATDAVTTVSRAAAGRFRDTFDLALLDAPFAETALAMTLVTAATRRSDRLLAWLCSVTREEAQRSFCVC